MPTIFVVVERAKGTLDETAFELLAAARGLGDVTVRAVLLGSGVGDLGTELRRWFDAVHLFDDASLAEPDGDLRARVLAPLLQREQPLATLLPHTNTGMELAPLLAGRIDAPLIADALALDTDGQVVRAVRTVYGGKVRACVAAKPGVVVSLRPGAFPPPASAPEAGGTLHAEPIPEGIAPRRRYVETVPPEPGAVDISQAEVLVAVGRGIEDEENLDLVRSLAEAMGAEVACTRPVVDAKWLEKSRQVGTSGVTVKPRIYLALGVSGSFQHLGGIKGGPFLAAINKDRAAPIFDIADVGIVGDIMDLIPLLEEKIRERRG